MDQRKIGKFISKCRKEKNMTQAGLAEKLNISDRAISKWENGNSLPDASIMLKLCEYLDINVNELLTGEKINNKNYLKKAEENLVKMTEQEEKNNKTLLMMEIVIGLICSITFIIILFVVCFSKLELIPRIVLIITATIDFIIGIFFAMKLERETGYYECQKCKHKYIPKLLPFWFSMHFCRTRYLKCPKCNTYSWNKKTISK